MFSKFMKEWDRNTSRLYEKIVQAQINSFWQIMFVQKTDLRTDLLCYSSKHSENVLKWRCSQNSNFEHHNKWKTQILKFLFLLLIPTSRLLKQTAYPRRAYNLFLFSLHLFQCSYLLLGVTVTLGCRVNLFGCREISRILIKRSRFINFNRRKCRKSLFLCQMCREAKKFAEPWLIQKAPNWWSHDWN